MREAYSFQDYIHDYAVWTAARAVQRKFTSTQRIKEAIDQSTLREFSESRECSTAEEFNNFHISCSNQIIETLKKANVANPTYGRAAKIIAIYLKTSLIIPMAGQGVICQFIHPPIDRILLTNLSKEHKIKKLCEKGWTALNEVEYWHLYERIKLEKLKFDWSLEKYWQPEQEKIESDKL
ncbi:hypothetical protein WBJ53_06545 [Spirosoma sp. SC4-14]|uniref:hypothetical protein n=1 Tax=Spirosoma sp. SC4-14 TaxID=3128900 RepID=UPI0030CD8B5F